MRSAAIFLSRSLVACFYWASGPALSGLGLRLASPEIPLFGCRIAYNWRPGGARVRQAVRRPRHSAHPNSHQKMMKNGEILPLTVSKTAPGCRPRYSPAVDPDDRHNGSGRRPKTPLLAALVGLLSGVKGVLLELDWRAAMIVRERTDRVMPARIPDRRPGSASQSPYVLSDDPRIAGEPVSSDHLRIYQNQALAWAPLSRACSLGQYTLSVNNETDFDIQRGASGSRTGDRDRCHAPAVSWFLVKLRLRARHYGTPGFQA